MKDNGEEFPRIDYSKRLVSLSWHFLSAKECDDRASVDIDNGFLYFNFRALPGDGEYFIPGEHSFTTFEGIHGKLLDCLHIDLLRPVFDYYDLKYKSLLLLLVQVEGKIIELLAERGIDAEWFMVGCTTANDSPVSALRRTLVFPNVGFNGEIMESTPRTADLPISLLAELELQLEQYFYGRAPIEHYA